MTDRSPLGLVRIARETVQERVYAALRDQLMRGGFEPGQKLKIAELAKAFGTSAMPVREALNRLAVERALETLPSRTVRVPALSKSALQDLRETRFAIEGLAISRAASNMTAESLTLLEQLIQAQSETDEEHVSEASARQNRAFHFAIYRQSGSAVLLPIIESLWLQFGPYLRAASERFDGGDGRGTNFHVDILDALSRGDGTAARAALEADIGRAFDLVMNDESLWQARGGAA
ncbi:MAG TPA: GntR family transcriptional regulator [Steroidobacteraceae bacterium]|jgi:DNA-binding GntR family transcriptional regulator|nr:GntR family transcriptional regulator [Steroidobacteraceae bacterium]